MADRKVCVLFQEGSEMECAQAAVIVEIRQTLAEVSKAMGTIAAQDERLKGHEQKNIEQDKSLGILFERVREIEKTLGFNGDGIRLKVVDAFAPFKEQIDRLENLLNLITSRTFVTIIISLFGMIVVGGLCDLAYHSDMLNMLFSWLVKLWSKVPR